MTSDRIPSPDDRRLAAFADSIFGGGHASREGIDPALAELIARIKREDRVPPFTPSSFTNRKETLMQSVVSWPLATEPLVLAPPNTNGARALPIPMPKRPVIQPERSLLLPLVSAAVLIALIGGLIFGIVANRNDVNPTVPAVIQGSPSPEASPLGSDWGQFRGGVERTGYTTDPGPGGDLNLQWSFNADESLNGIVEAGGTVFAYGAEGGLYAIDALTGEQRWALDLSPAQSLNSGKVLLPAAVGDSVFVSTQDGVLVAINSSNGVVRWQSDLADKITSAPVVDGTVIFVVTNAERLHALALDTGSELWAHELPSRLNESYPTIANGVYYYPGATGEVVALDAASGDLVWMSEPLSTHRVAAYQDGMLFVPTMDGALVALDAGDGTVAWSASADGGEGLNPVITPEAVILATAGTSLRSFDPKTGAVQWALDAAIDPGTESPHAAGETLYLLLADRRLAAIDLATGDLATEVEATGAGSTAAVSGGLLFLSGREGPIRAFGGADGVAQDTQATPPAVAFVATPAADTASAGSDGIQAPVSGDIEAISILAIPHSSNDPTLTLFESPEGLLWRIGLDGTIEILDRDGNLVETRPHVQGSGPGEFDLVHSSSEINWAAASVAWLGDKIYITDLANSRVQVFDAEGSYLESWGIEGEADGQLLAPVAITATADDQLVVADLLRGDLQWFEPDGTFVRKLSGPTVDQSFRHPVDVAFDGDGNLWVLDHTLAQLFKFSPDGTLLLTVGNLPGAAPGQFYEPSDIEIDDHGRVWVADQTNLRLQVFDLQGNLLGIFDPCGSDIGCFMRPGIVLYGGNDFFYVLDYDINGIRDEQIYKFKITSMPEVPIMAAATPAPAASPTGWLT